jgi:Ca2+/Na+ antiporter
MGSVYIITSGIFVFVAVCFLLFQASDQLEKIGERLSKLLRVPEDVGASTLGALATSGPEIIMAILAATAFIGGNWAVLEFGEKASSGTLNMAFSAMDNLLGIGCVGIIFMIYKGYLDPNEIIRLSLATNISLSMYVVASSLLYIFIADGVMTPGEGWVMAYVGIAYILFQFIIPVFITKFSKTEDDDEERAEEDELPLPTTFYTYTKELISNGFVYAFLVFLLIILVRECMGATFNIASLGIVSVGGILLAFTSYVSSFPEFMLTYRYAVANKKSALLGMLFGSNVIDLGFSGFRAFWLNENVEVYTTGIIPGLLPFYIAALPIIASFALLTISLGIVKYKIAYPMVAFYGIYILSGLIFL